MSILFLISAVVAVFSTAMVITRRNAVHALIYMVISFIAASVMFYTLGAPYAAVLEIIVYAGAIMVFFVFVVMMLNMSVSPEDEKRTTGIKSWIFPLILTLVLIADFIYAFVQGVPQTNMVKVIDAKRVGVSMFTTYLLMAELGGILLLVAIVGAYHLGRAPKRNIHRYLQNEQTQK
jgi:NADH-quinone oxidoreductase subunit J